jgi:hypothetical protein
MALAPQPFATADTAPLTDVALAPPAPAAAPFTFDQLAAAPVAFQTQTPLDTNAFGPAPTPAQPIATPAAPTQPGTAPVQFGAAPAPAPVQPAADKEPDYEGVVKAVQSGDPALRPVKTAYDAAYDVEPEDGPRAARAWMLRLGLNPDDQTEAGRRRNQTWLKYDGMTKELGYDSAQLSRIAAEAEDKPEGRRALFEAVRSRVVEDVDKSFAAAREQVSNALEAQLNSQRDARDMQGLRALQDQRDRQLAALTAQRDMALRSDAAIQQQNRANSFINPVTGKLEYLPGYSPREAAKPEQAMLRFEQQRERLMSQYDQQLAQFDTRSSNSALRQEESANKERLRLWDREASAQKSSIVRNRVADLNAFLAARLEDAKPDEADGALLPYKDDAEIAREKIKKTEGTKLGAAGDIALDFGKGALLSPVSGLAQIATWGTDKAGLTQGALAAVQRYADTADAWAESNRSEAGAEQKKQTAENIAKATEGKTGVAALGAGALAGVTSFGLDRNTFGQIASMVGAFVTGSLVTRGVGAVGSAVAGGARATGAAAEGVGAGAVTALAEGGAVAADKASRVQQVVTGAAFAGQTADAASRDAGNDMAQLLKDPQYRASSPLLADLRTKFPGYSDAQIDELAVRQVRGAAAAGGAAATALSMVIPGLGGVEAQLLRINAPMIGAARQGATGTAMRAAGRAVSEGVQEFGEDLFAAGAAGVQAGVPAQFVDAGKLGASFGAGAALGGVVGNAHAAFERARGRGGPQTAPEPAPLPEAPVLGPDTPAPAQTPAPLTLPSPAVAARTGAEAQLAEAARGTANEGAIVAFSPQTVARQEAARIAGEDAAKIPEIERVLLDIGRNTDSAAGASVATLVGEYATSYGVDIPEGSVIHFGNNEAHYKWAGDLVKGKEETVVFSTPPGTEGVAVTRSVTQDGTNIFTAHSYDGTTAVIGGEVAPDSELATAPDTDLHTYGAAVIAGLNQLGADIRVGAKESLAADTILLQTAEAVRARSVEDYRSDNGSIDPSVAAVSAVGALQRVRTAYDNVSDATKGPLDQLLSAAFPDAPKGNPAQAILQDPLKASAQISEAFSAGALSGTKGRDATRAYGAALKIVDLAHEAAHEARLAEQYLAGEADLPSDTVLTRRQVAAVSSVISQPMRVVPPEARAAVLGAVPNTGRFRPGSTFALDTRADTDETRAAYAAFRLADDLQKRPGLSVAQARNLALHYGAGRVDVRDTVNAALQMAAEQVATAEAAQQEALRLTEAQRAWENEGGAIGRGFPMLMPKAAQPVSRGVLNQIAAFMARKFSNTKLQIEVIETDTDPRAGGNRGFAGLTVNVDASTVRVILNRERIASVADAKKVIEHEVYGHFAPMEVLGPKKFAAVNAAVLRFAKRMPRPRSSCGSSPASTARRTTRGRPARTSRVQRCWPTSSSRIASNASDLTERVTKALRGSPLTAGELTAPT